MKKLIKQPSAHWQISKLAHLLIFLRPANLLILTLANLLILTACSKSDEPEVPASVQTPEHLTDWTPQPKVDVAQPYMAFATGSTSATTLSLTAVGSTTTATDVWVDTNNNGVFDEGTDVKVTDFSKPVTFKVTDKVFTVYGAVKELTATGNALTAADVRSNEALTKLNVANNQLDEKALLNLVKSLPAATGTTAVVLQNTEGDRNMVDEAVLIAAKERGWQTLKIKDNVEVPDLPADTEAPKAGAITEATATAFNSVLVKWTAATDDKTAAEKLRYQVLYNVQGSGEVKTSEVKENMLELSLTGLAEKTSYIVKVKVLDEAGNATDYEAKEVTTPAAPEAADTEAPKAGAITEATATFNSLSLKWTAATDNKTAAEKLRYQVLYEVKGSGEVKTSALKENMLNFTLTGLAEKTTYIIKVKVMDEAGNATDYEAKEVTTPAAPVTADTEAPKVGTITKVESSMLNTILVEWTPATDNKTAAEKLRYQVVYQVKGSMIVKTTELTENKLSYTLTYLNKNTTYIIKVRVLDEAGNTAEYEAKEVTVFSIDFSDKEAPKVGTITKVLSSAFKTILVEWTAATDNKTPQEKLRYQVVYQVKGSSEEKTTELTENKLFHTITFAKKYKTYVIKVRVMDEDGNTAEYAPKEVTVGKIPGPNGDLDKTYFIKLTTDKPIGDKIEIKLDAAYDDRKGVWIDLNNNGEWDDGIDAIPQEFGNEFFHTKVKNRTFTVYGKLSDFSILEGLISELKLYNPELQSLTIRDCNLTSLTLPTSYALKGLYVADNPLTSLQLGDMPYLEVLDVDNTKLTSLDISAYPKLKDLRVEGTPLTSLDASKNPLLKRVFMRRYYGKGLNGKALEDFVKSLPDGKGEIYLTTEQKTPTAVNILGLKGWEIK